MPLSSVPQFDYDVFISYSSKDSDWVHKWLLVRLESAGLRVCIDFRDFTVGTASLHNMADAVKQSRHIMLVLTENWINSEFTRFEALLAQMNDPAGRERRILPLKVDGCSVPDPLSHLTYADFIDPNQHDHQVQRLISSIQRDKPLAASPSHPFAWRNGITNPADFFNREREQKTLKIYLNNGQNCQIVGPRRIGKTSFLRYVEAMAPLWNDKLTVAYLDLQSAACFTLSGWLHQAYQQFDWPATSPSLVQFEENLYRVRAQGRRPVLCLDEFEEISMRREEFTHNFFSALRSCGQAGLSICTASRKPLSQLTDRGDPTSPFYNTFPIIRLGPFSNADASDYVTISRDGIPSFTAEEKQAILEFANGHPLALQIACLKVVQGKENGDSLIRSLKSADDDLSCAMLQEE